MSEKNYYEILGINPDSDDEIIRKSISLKIREIQTYINSLESHIREKAENEMKILLEARTILLNTDRREEYDQRLSRTGLLKIKEAKISFKKEEKIVGVKTQEAFSLSLLIDTSGSMYGEKINHAKNALISFLNRVNLTKNEVGIIEFGDNVRIIHKLSHNYKILCKSINKLRADGTTPLLEALILGYENMLMKSKGAPVFVIATDGHPDESKEKILEYASKIKEKEVRIITIGIGNDVDNKFLKKLASFDKDYHFAQESFELESIYKTIATGLAIIKQTKE